MAHSIRLRTAVPGPRSTDLLARREQAVARGIAVGVPIFVERARGALVTDIDGNVLLDFAGGIGVLNVGHCNDEVVRAARAQLERLTHSCFAVAMYEPYVALAEKLNAITPGNFAKKTVFANSGAEATENAVKIARHFTGREAVVVFEHGFHGRTLFALGMTSKYKPYKLGFGPFAPEIYRLPYPYEYRRQAASDEPTFAAELAAFFASHVAPERVACVVLEPVAGEGGIIPAPASFVRALSSFCRDHGILLIMDEVQTGFCRTGRMFASEHFGVEPDLLAMAKSLAGGLPLSAVTGRAEIMDSAGPGGLGGTFVGNPVACAAALAAIDFMEREGLAARAAAIGEIVGQRFAALRDKFPSIGDARGLGAMRALELVKDRASREPDPDAARRVHEKAYRNGLILVTAGTFGNVVRTLMPLVITDEQLAEGLEVLEYALG